MKNIFITLAILFLCISCNQEKSKIEKLNKQAIAEYNTPIRPGYEGRNPYWNKFSRKFMYAPAFDFKAIEGATTYRYTIKENNTENAKEWSFTADAPNKSLAPIWQQISSGYVTLTVEALDKDNNNIGQAGKRSFYRNAPFTAPYPEAIRSYKESIILALKAIHNIPQIQHWKNDTTPDMTYELNCYPCKIISTTVSAEVKLAQLCPELKDDALKIAENAAQFLINHSRPEDAPLAYFPPTYYGENLSSGAHSNKNKTMAMEALTAANAFLDLYDATGKQEYYDRAINITDTYARLQAEDGSFPIKMDLITGEPVNNVCAMLHPLLDYIQRLEQQYKITKYQAMRLKAEEWMQEKALKAFDMTGQFEDFSVVGLEPYENLTNCTAAPYATYLLGKEQCTDNELKDAIDLIRFSEDQFTYWGNPNFKDDAKVYNAPCVVEQYKFQVPIDASLCNVASAYISLYKKTGDELAYAKAKAMIDNITIVQDAETGMIPTFWGNKQYGQDWINCSYFSIQTLLKMDQLMTDSKKN